MCARLPALRFRREFKFVVMVHWKEWFNAHIAAQQVHVSFETLSFQKHTRSHTADGLKFEPPPDEKERE